MARRSEISRDEFIEIVTVALREGKSNQQIAKELGMNPASFAVRLSTTRTKLDEYCKTKGLVNPLRVERKRGRGNRDTEQLDNLLMKLMTPVDGTVQPETDETLADEFSASMSEAVPENFQVLVDETVG
jgi:transposase-like protein